MKPLKGSLSMRFNRRQITYGLIIITVITFLSVFQLPYYIYKPGNADPLTEIVEVEGGYKGEGEMHLVTVSGGQATPIHYLWAKISNYYDVLPLEQVRPKEISKEEYLQAQLQMMEGSQDASVVVAYEAANQEVSFVYHGVRVISVEENMPAEHHLQAGDLITGIDDKAVKEAEDLVDYITHKNVDDIVTIVFERDGEPSEAEIVLESFIDPEGEERVGIGIQLVTDRKVDVDPPIEFSSGNIGGPSAGLMFALEIYNQLIEEDISKGYQIIGSGEIHYDGTVHAIGQIDKKIVAAHRAGCEVFFVPYEKGKEGSNYEVALETAEALGTDMEIIPIDTFEEALDYLKNLPEK